MVAGSVSNPDQSRQQSEGIPHKWTNIHSQAANLKINFKILSTFCLSISPWITLTFILLKSHPHGGTLLPEKLNRF